MERNNKLLLVDFGSQFTQLLLHFYRKGGIVVDVINMDTYKSIIKELDNIRSINKTEYYCGIILSGGPGNIKDDFSSYQIKNLVNNFLRISSNILGICYGSQLLSIYLDGEIHYLSDSNQEYGATKLNLLHNDDDIFRNVKESCKVWMSHHDYIMNLPQFHNDWKTVITSLSDNGILSSFTSKKGDNNLYGLQFHPEVSHTECGDYMLANFLEKCGLNFCNSINILKDIERKTIDLVGTEHIVIAVSGGVDSTVLAVLLYKLFPNQVHPIFIDNGLLRKGEVLEIKNNFSKLGININIVNASRIFLDRLIGITEPEKKRKIIGKTFIEIFENESNILRQKYNVKWLAQGTIYPDVIESSSRGGKVVIKSHHNVGGLPDNMDLKLLEPFRYFFKDDIRNFGTMLNIPSDILNRCPFPGPGLAIRCLGEVTENRLATLREADHIFNNMLKSISGDINNFSKEVWQSATILLPVKSVGVKGDSRCYENPIVLRAVNSVNGMTCRPSRLPAEFLENVATQITNKVDGVNRVVYDYTSKPPGTIEWE